MTIGVTNLEFLVIT